MKPDGYWRGDAFSLTGKEVKISGQTFLEAELLEGAKKGEKIVVPRKEDTVIRIEGKRRQWEEEQEDFRRLAGRPKRKSKSSRSSRVGTIR